MYEEHLLCMYHELIEAKLKIEELERNISEKNIKVKNLEESLFEMIENEENRKILLVNQDKSKKIINKITEFLNYKWSKKMRDRSEKV